MSESLVIACVKWGKMFGPCYANILYDMVRRNLNLPFKFICFTDDADGLHADIIPHGLPDGLTGWWNKLYLFKSGVFESGQRIIYFDLDTLITGPLENIAAYNGKFALLRDFYRPGGYGSGVMLWQAGANNHIWSMYEEAGKPEIRGGDQAWLEQVNPGAYLLQDLFPGSFASYKVHCHPLPPEGTRVVCFHGEPKQDNADEKWIADIWKIGGALKPDFEYKSRNEELAGNIRHAISLPYSWLEAAPAHRQSAVICGGGPSLNQCVDEIRRHSEQGDMVFAVGRQPIWFEENNIAFAAHILFNAGEEDAEFPAHGPAKITCYYASTCDPAVFEKSRGKNIIIWHPFISGVTELIQAELSGAARRAEFIGVGNSAGLRAICLAYALGYRTMHLYGFDSCNNEVGEGHTCPRAGDDKERVIDFAASGRHFDASPKMTQQAQEFAPLIHEMIKNGCNITIYGDGMIPFIAGLIKG